MVCSFFRPALCLVLFFEVFLGVIGHLVVFLLLKTLMKLCLTESDFSGKLFLRPKWGNGPEIDQKIEQFELKENFGH